MYASIPYKTFENIHFPLRGSMSIYTHDEGNKASPEISDIYIRVQWQLRKSQY